MTDRKSLTIDAAAFEHLAEHKRDDESWSEFAHRVADTLESPDESVSTPEHNTGSISDDVLTEDHLDDIARATADEVEDRMTRR